MSKQQQVLADGTEILLDLPRLGLPRHGELLVDALLERIAGADVPMPYAINLEKTALPQVADTVNAALRTMFRKK